MNKKLARVTVITFVFTCFLILTSSLRAATPVVELYQWTMNDDELTNISDTTAGASEYINRASWNKDSGQPFWYHETKYTTAYFNRYGIFDQAYQDNWSDPSETSCSEDQWANNLWIQTTTCGGQVNPTWTACGELTSFASKPETWCVSSSTYSRTASGKSRVVIQSPQSGKSYDVQVEVHGYKINGYCAPGTGNCVSSYYTATEIAYGNVSIGGVAANSSHLITISIVSPATLKDVTPALSGADYGYYTISNPVIVRTY